MSWNENKVKIAILDLYEGHVNQGMRCIREIINTWAEQNQLDVALEEFDVRLNLEVPDTSFDVYISTGGPGSPIDSKGSDWEEKYFSWLSSIEQWNKQPFNKPKYAFFICHSFQLVCRHYELGNVCKRKSTSFGVFPMHQLEEGLEEVVFEGLKEPFYGVDSRDYQVIEPNHPNLRAMGATILAIEKNRPHVPYERALMSIRFNEYFIGTQFHPEADATGMTMYLQRDDKKETVIANHGEEKWKSMLEHLSDPDKILWTYSCILPNFLNQAIGITVEA
ncbi:MAG: GMP synthase [Chitinophagaceae bacterium]|jgi:GMP synthase-like glutamine amidotransferase|nr:homoserine O-succinyltransferase [Chitinophagaceae bacterium]MBP9739041.1 homoserine O-succinyltransferase [Chitinophagaceae bacterium]